MSDISIPFTKESPFMHATQKMLSYLNEIAFLHRLKARYFYQHNLPRNCGSPVVNTYLHYLAMLSSEF